MPSVRIGSSLLAIQLALLLAGCAPSEHESDYLARRALLERQNRGLRELIAEEEKGSLVPEGRFLIGVDESVVGGLFRSQLPLERPLGKRFIMRLDSATVAFWDKFGEVTIQGSVHRPASPDRMTAVRIHGGLGAVTIDPATSLLHITIAIDHIEILEAGFLDGVLGRGGKKFIAEMGRPMIQDAIPPLEVPVALGRPIKVPAIEAGGIRLDSLTVPLDLSVERVMAAAGKLWVTLHARVGTVTGAEQGVGVAVRKTSRKRGAR